MWRFAIPFANSKKFVDFSLESSWKGLRPTNSSLSRTPYEYTSAFSLYMPPNRICVDGQDGKQHKVMTATSTTRKRRSNYDNDKDNDHDSNYDGWWHKTRVIKTKTTAITVRSITAYLWWHVKHSSYSHCWLFTRRGCQTTQTYTSCQGKQYTNLATQQIKTNNSTHQQY